MNDQMLRLYAGLTSILANRRNDKGQTSAEYVGILVFVALLVVAIIGFATPLGTTIKTSVIDPAIQAIADELP